MGSNYIGAKLQDAVQYSDYADAAFELYRREGFPVFSLNRDEKQAELRKLIRYDHSSIISEKGVIKQTMHGLALAWNYHPHAWAVRCSNMRTPHETYLDDAAFRNVINKRIRFTGKISDNGIRKQLRIHTGTQAVSNFRPTAAAAIYHKFLPKEGGVVWDPSMGWGGRMLGSVACSKVKKYIGCEPATETFEGLIDMEADIKRLMPERQFETSLHMLGSETKEMRDALPEGGVNLIFSSPPYFDCEKYTHEATQSWVKCQRENPKATRDAWLTEFIGDTLDNCRYALKPGGILAINIADVKGYPDLSRRFVEFAECHGWRLVDTMKLSLSKIMGAKRKYAGTHKYEPIFVFRKTL
ncbi:MAG TPA: DNA methyltransferase [Candidatus Acidoferrales bacterium]|jgi:hypothetical protein|nr:DNA methyltransferase [Candidatus Acidoferrales bacterium]